MKRASIASALTLSLIITCSWITGSASGAPPAARPTAAAQIDLSDPAAGINDPVTEYTTLDRNCTAGQTDVNTASAGQLMVAFRINGPTAQRVISGREWLKPTDILSVPGVPRSSRERITVQGCASPLTLPSTPVNQCKSGSAALDLQVATQVQLMTEVGLSRATSLSLIAARPLPDNLHQVAAPVIFGLSDPHITELMASGKVCITPIPFTYNGRTWRWVSNDDGAVIAAAGDARYAVYIPAGVLSVDGGYASVQPNAIEVHNMPSMQVHIEVPWAGEVAVRLPHDAGALDTGNEPIGFHWASNGLRLSMGQQAIQTANDRSTSVFAVTDLSDVGLAELPWASAPDDQRLVNGFIYEKGQSFRDQDLTQIMAQNTLLESNRIASIPTEQQEQPSELPTSNARTCLPAVGLARTRGTPPEGVGCAVEEGLDSATWTLANGEKTALGGVLNPDIVFTAKLGSPATYNSGSFYSDWLGTWFQGDLMNPPGTTEPVLLPDSSIQASVPAGAGQAAIIIKASGDRTWQWFAARQFTDLVQVGEAVGGLSLGTLSENQNCGVQLAMNMATGSPDPASACFGAAFDTWSSHYEPNTKIKRLLKVTMMLGKETAGRALLAGEAFTVKNRLDSSAPAHMTLEVLRADSPGEPGAGANTALVVGGLQLSFPDSQWSEVTNGCAYPLCETDGFAIDETTRASYSRPAQLHLFSPALADQYGLSCDPTTIGVTSCWGASGIHFEGSAPGISIGGKSPSWSTIIVSHGHTTSRAYIWCVPDYGYDLGLCATYRTFDDVPQVSAAAEAVLADATWNN